MNNGTEVDNFEVGENLNETDSEHLKHFIEVYETLPELWNPRLPSYKNRTIRKKALLKLIPIYQKLKPNADEAEVRKKINSLRTNYRKEVKKIIASKRSGCGEDEIYTPTSWVFHALQFLGESELPVDYEVDVNESMDVQETQNLTEKPATTTIATSGNSSVSSITPQTFIPNKKIKSSIAKQNELISLACKYLDKPNPTESNDKFDCLAKVWANKLRELEKTQMLLAEKAINDILFQASMNTLQMPNNSYSPGSSIHSQITSPSYSATNTNIYSPGSSSNSHITSPPPPQAAAIHETILSSEQNSYMFASQAIEDVAALYVSNFTTI